MKPTTQAIENAARAMLHERGLIIEPTDLALRQAAAALSADLGDMVLVPREATQAMIREGLEVYSASAKDNCADVYRAMLAAAKDEP